ncbi:GntR family transcriptional regulator [Puniceicoccus vermicola]|uniref:GntR family transcriptional regulator n=1 Tax=Puniceicoccus vermicola TaxID=388746 RepID=A0A7X1B2B1_9BACT|nr:GntR family transcriptional regulator [Puniceicoccus vermicola]MBC2604313.1 GntR family transcriptional regulator [Puniceicoccus vermicola]
MPKKKTAKNSVEFPEELDFQIQSNEVAYLSITQKIRDLILSRRLLPGTRLPTLPHLAEHWGTNYYTVQTALTPLVNEGLLIRRQRSGTFVAQDTPQMRSIGFYFGAHFWTVNSASFYQGFYLAAREFFEVKGIQVHLFIDTRKPEQQTEPWKPLIDAIKACSVNAVIGSLLNPTNVSWLVNLRAPKVLMTGAVGAGPYRLAFDNHFLEKSFRRLHKRGCKRVGLICSYGFPEFDEVERLARKFELAIKPTWVKRFEGGSHDFEEVGYLAFDAIWSQSERPDGIVIHPDSIGKGVIMSILKHQVKIPEDVNLVMHSNDKVYFHCPLPIDWAVVSVGRLLEESWAHLKKQLKGEVVDVVDVPISFTPRTIKSPPVTRTRRNLKAT